MKPVKAAAGGRMAKFQEIALDDTRERRQNEGYG
jgi:hypothetical protein